MKLVFKCKHCGKKISIERERLRLCGDCAIREIIDTRTFPAAKSFTPFICENLFPQPVEVKSTNHFKELQRSRNVHNIGDDGQKQIKTRVLDRSNENRKKKIRARQEARTYKGTLPKGYGKKKPYDPRLEHETRSKHDHGPIVI